MSEDDLRLARLKRLPPRLRVAHLAALLRWERAANAAFVPPPSQRAARVAGAQRRRVGVLLSP